MTGRHTRDRCCLALGARPLCTWRSGHGLFTGALGESSKGWTILKGWSLAAKLLSERHCCIVQAHLPSTSAVASTGQQSCQAA